MTTDLTFFTNEPGATLLDRFKRTLSDVKYFDILVGYFRTSGFHQLYDALETVDHIRILVGLTVDQKAFELIEVETGTNHAITPQFTPVKSLNPPYPDIPALVKQYGQALSPSAIQGADWMLTSSGSADIFKKMQQVGMSLEKYINGQIYRGVLTGCNQAFVIDSTQRANLINEDIKNANIIKPLIIGDDTRKWNIKNEGKKWLLFIPWHFPLHQETSISGVSLKAEQEFCTQFPAIYNHLSNFKSQLSARNKAETGIRYEWYALQRCAATYWQEFEKPKIIFPEICKEPRFTFDRSGVFTNNKAFIIPLDDLYLLGILNSACAWEYTKLICSSLGDENKGGRLMLQWVNFKKLPIPPASPADKARIETLVQQCLTAQGQAVAATEAEIDDIVTRLYGLTEAERAIIQGREG